MTAIPHPAIVFALTVIVSYLVGSIPFGLLLTKIAGAGDIRAIGSGNIGATNVLRTGRKGLAALTMLLDTAKGLVVVLIAKHWQLDLGVTAAFCVVIGHNFPIWLRFKGGKGVATTFGVMLAIAWPVGAVGGATWLAVLLVSRISSLAALVALAATPFYAWWLSSESVVLLAAALAVLGIARHHANIRRLLAGEEGRVGRNK
jgi:glycerol-3-phosphate acyltransferase PlsY